MLSMIRKSRKSSSSFMCRFIYIVMLCLDPLFAASKYHYQMNEHMSLVWMYTPEGTPIFFGENHTQNLHVFNFKGTIENAKHVHLQWQALNIACFNTVTCCFFLFLIALIC